MSTEGTQPIRTWRLIGDDVSVDVEAVSGPSTQMESVAVIELEPSLDLLERAVNALHRALSDLDPDPDALAFLADAEALLREHGRL